MLALSAIGLAFAAPGVAQERADYLGDWRIVKAQPAPWFDPADPGTAPHASNLVGKTIRLRAKRIMAPRLLACPRPDYAVEQVEPAGLFQGGLRDPERDAAALGFPDGLVRTLQTRCEASFDYHFLDARTAMFALNNMIYTIRRQ